MVFSQGNNSNKPTDISSVKNSPTATGNSSSDNKNNSDDTKEAKRNEALGKKTEVLTKVLKYGTSLERKAGLVEIEKLPPEFQSPLKPLLVEALKKEKEPTMRIAFLKTMGNLQIKESLDEMKESVGDENEDLSRQAVISLKKLNLPDSWEVIFSRLKTEDLTKNSNLTIALIESLAEMDGGEGASEWMESKLKESFNSQEIRSQIALYMGKKKILSSETTLQKIAFDEKETLTLRNYAINSLGKIGSQSSIPKLRELIDDLRNKPSGSDSRKNQLLKIYSLAALVDLGAEGVFEEIVEFTRDDDSFVRFRAIQFLADTKRPEAKEILEYKSLRDPSPKIQKYAKDQLENWDKPSSDEKKENTP